MSAADKSFDLVIEGHIACRYRQSVYDRFDHARTENSRYRAINGCNLVADIHRVAREKLIAAIAAQRDRDMLADKTR